MRTMKFNPGFLSDDELTATFCVRTEEFDSIMEMLRECRAASNPHRLIVGPRGSGKTTLLLRVAAELRKDPEFSRSFLPIVFAEESYSISSAGEFWLEALARLAEQAPDAGDRDELDAAYDEIRHTPDETMLGQRCLAAILDFADRANSRLVLIVENLNMIFSQLLDRQMEWELRKVLQTESRILLLASASNRFDEIDNPDRAFFDLFVTHTLHPLDTEQCAKLWRKVTGQKRETEAMGGIRVLTGGSPRFVAILARFGAHLSFGNLLSELHGLIDELTEYFRNHLEALPPQERRVYVALLKIWEPATARQVGDLARLDTNKCSALLNRLAARGIVEVVGGGTRRKLYYSSERLYNIFFLMRNSHSPNPLIEALIKFIDSFYAISDIKKLGLRMIGELTESIPEHQDFGWMAFGKLIELRKLEPYKEQLLSKVADIAPDYIKHNFVDDSRERKSFKRSRDAEPPSLEQFVGSLFALKARLHAKFDELEEAVDACDAFLAHIDSRDDTKFEVSLAICLVVKGLALLELDRDQDHAIELLNEAVSRFESNTSSEIRYHVLVACTFLGRIELENGRLESAIDKATWMLEHAGGEYPDWEFQALILRACAHFEMGEYIHADKDLIESLNILPDTHLGAGTVTKILVEYAIVRGTNEVLEMVRQSPSADLLRPLTVALELESGLQPLVAKEIEEVAEDIRKDFRERLATARQE